MSAGADTLSAVLMDRDGVINRELGRGVRSWEEFEFLPGVLPALQQLAALPLRILVLSNQSAIGRGWVAADVVDTIHRHMRRMVREAGGRIDDVMICPHAPDAGCVCRKPRPGLLLQGAQKHGFDLHRAVMVGDSYRDVQAAQAAGAVPVLVRSGHRVRPEVEARLRREHVRMAPDLAAVAQAIVNGEPFLLAEGERKATIGRGTDVAVNGVIPGFPLPR